MNFDQKQITIKVFGMFLIMMLVISCSNDDTKSVESPKSTTEAPENFDNQNNYDTIIQKPESNNLDDLSVQVYSIDSGFAYKINLGEKPMIDQKHIPGVQGLKYFKSEEDARNAGMLMLYKLENNIMPPSVTLNELDSLNISY